ncbi:MAG: hypothetical protein R3C56_32045 [Pirellulaceae bacterium]
MIASGSNKENPAASYYKILRDPDLIMENTTHLFLAVRFNCNKCHDHPFGTLDTRSVLPARRLLRPNRLQADPTSEGKTIGGSAVDGAKPLYEVIVDKLRRGNAPCADQSARRSRVSLRVRL